MRTQRLFFIIAALSTAALVIAGLILSGSADSRFRSEAVEIDAGTKKRHPMTPSPTARRRLAPLAAPESPKNTERPEKIRTHRDEREIPGSSLATGRWLHADGRPRSGERLWIEPCSMRPGNETRLSTLTRSDGTFSFLGLSAGTYRITGYPTGSRRFHWPTGPFTIGHESTTDLGVAIDSSSLSIAGRVRAENLDPESLFPVVVALRSEGHERSLATETDSDGRFRFNDLDGLSYAAEVVSPGYRSKSPVQIHAGTQDAEIIVAPAHGAIHVTAIDEHGLSIEHGMVEVFDQPDVLGQPRDAGPTRSGSYTSRPLPPGRYQIRVTAAGRSPWAETRAVGTGDVHARALMLPAPMLRRRLCESDGEVIADAEVIFTCLDPHRFRGELKCEQRHATVRTDIEGYFETPIDRSGLIVTFLRDGRPRWRGAVGDLWQIETGQNILLPPAAQIRGQVLDASGRPVVGAGVRADPAGWTRTLGAPIVLTDSNGRFHVETIAPGPSNLSVLDYRGRVLMDAPAFSKAANDDAVLVRLDIMSNEGANPSILESEAIESW